jgi:prepilin-type N-terminal cleavage/methylation domain-containing protein
MLLHVSIPAKPSLHHRRGFTLTEIAIVLGVMGIILGAI